MGDSNSPRAAHKTHSNLLVTMTRPGIYRLDLPVEDSVVVDEERSEPETPDTSHDIVSSCHAF